MNGFKELAIPIVANADDLPFGSTSDSINSKRIVAIRTRTGGKTTGKKNVVSEAVLKTMLLVLRDHKNNEMCEVPLTTVLQMSESVDGKGLIINDFVAFPDCKIKCLDTSLLVEGQAVALLIEFENKK